jgi:hypothetical protein
MKKFLLLLIPLALASPAFADSPTTVCASGFVPSAYNGTYTNDGSDTQWLKNSNNDYHIYQVFGILYEIDSQSGYYSDGAFAINPNQLITPVGTYDVNNSPPRDGVQGGTVVSGDCFIPPPPPPTTGTSTAWMPESSQLLGNVTSATVLTGQTVYGMFQYMGIPLAFVIGIFLMQFIMSATGKKMISRYQRRKNPDNLPGLPGYDSTRGSGKSSENVALTDDDKGGHMKSYRF